MALKEIEQPVATPNYRIWSAATQEKIGHRWFEWLRPVMPAVWLWSHIEYLFEWVIWVYKRSQVLEVATVGFALYGMWVYVADSPERESQVIRSAQMMIYTPGPTTKGSERRKALETLVERGVDLRGISLDEWNFNGERRLLVRANLEGSPLRETQFDKANLREADLSRTDLTKASFRSAQLNRAKFREADLTLVDFKGADLTEADFSGAYLIWVDFSNANLQDAVLEGVVLNNADLSSVGQLSFEQLASAFWHQDYPMKLGRRLEAQVKLNMDAGNFEIFPYDSWDTGDYYRWKEGATPIELPDDWNLPPRAGLATKSN